MTWNGEHTAGLEHAWSKFRRKAFALYSLSQQQDRSASGAALKKVLGPFDLVLLGIGGIIGAGEQSTSCIGMTYELVLWCYGSHT